MRKIPFSLLQKRQMDRIPYCIYRKIRHLVDIQISLVWSYWLYWCLPNFEGSKNNWSCHIISNYCHAIFFHKLFPFLLNRPFMSSRWLFTKYLLCFEDQISSISPKFHVLIFLPSIFPHSIALFMFPLFMFSSIHVKLYLSSLF